jgi:hypothetical protein
VSFEIADNGVAIAADVNWGAPDARTQDAWSNTNDATRDGAYACVIAAAELTRSFFAVRRAETLTGADYYIAGTGAGVEDLEECIRLDTRCGWSSWIPGSTHNAVGC